MRAADLTGAWITRVRRQDDRLVLTLTGIRRRRLLFAGDVTFDGVSTVEGSDPRLTSGAPALTAGMTIRAEQSRPGETVLDLLRQTGPGDADEPRFAITHRDVTVTLRLDAEATARSWLGFYPLPRDRQASPPTGLSGGLGGRRRTGPAAASRCRAVATGGDFPSVSVLPP
jgi:hypothetical protein